jgi:negative regulator of sigma E activity
MDRFADDERISAYLDGELTADEQSQFEDRLAESAELRQLVEELRALRGSLDLLPRHRLEDDFAERVLRRAEREVLVSGQPQSDSSPAGPPAIDHRPASLAPAADRLTKPRRRSLRPLIYAAVAIAAAVLIVIFDPTRPKERELAQVDQRKSESTAKREISSLEGLEAPAATRQSRSQFADDEKTASPLRDEQNKRSGAGGVDKSQPVEMKLDKVVDQTEKDAKAVNELKQSRDAYGNVAEDHSLKEANAKGVGGLGTETAREAADRGGAGKPTVTDAEGATKLAENHDADHIETNLSVRAKSDASAAGGFGGANPAGIASDRSNAPAGGGQGARRGDQLGLGRRDPETAGNRPRARDEALAQNSPAADGLVVAECVTNGQTSAEALFSHLLATHEITWGVAADNSTPLSYYATKSEPESSPGNATLSDRTNRWSMQLGQLAELERGGGWRKDGAEKDQAGQKFDMVYVEGTAEQVKGLIHDIQGEKSVFQSVSLNVVPANFQARSFQAHSFGNLGTGVPTEAGAKKAIQLGSAPMSQPALKQPESGNAPRPGAVADDALPAVDALATPASAGRASGGGSASNGAKSMDKSPDPTLEPSKSSPTTDHFAEIHVPAAEFRRTRLPADAKKPPPAGAQSSSAPAAAATDLNATIAGRAGAEMKPSEERGVHESSSQEREELQRKLARSTGVAVRLRALDFDASSDAAKPAADNGSKQIADSPAEPAAKGNGAVLREHASAAKQDFGALGGESATPTPPSARYAAPELAQKPASKQRSAKSDGEDGDRASEAVAKSGAGTKSGAVAKNGAEEGKTDLFSYAPAGTVAVADGTKAPNVRMRAILVFRAAPQAALEAHPAAPPAAPPAAAEAGKK